VDTSFGADNQFMPLQIHTCMDIKRHIADTTEAFPADLSCGSSNTFEIFDGGVKAFRVVTPIILEDGSSQTGMHSACKSVTDAKAITNIKLPYGSLGAHFMLPVRVKAYASAADCESKKLLPSKVYDFDKGLAEFTPNFEGAALPSSVTSMMNVFVHSDICVGNQLTNTPFAAGNGANSTGPKLICSKNQFNAMNAQILADSDTSFVLGADINIAGNVTVPSVFSGSFAGDGHTLSGGTSPIFSTIQTSTTNRSRIDRLVLDNFNISSTSSLSYNLGILANSILGTAASMAQEIEISDITLMSTCSVNTASSNTSDGSVGTLVGDIDFSAVTSNARLSIRNIESYASVSSNTTTAGLVIGGLAGSALGSSTNSNVSFENIQIGINKLGVQQRVTLAGIDMIGGVVGLGGFISIRESNAVVRLEGNSFMGGLIASSLDGVRVENSQVDASFIPNSANASDIGGFIGGIISDYEVYINGSIAKLDIPVTSYKISKVGGAIGSIAHGAAAKNIELNNIKTNLHTLSNGDNYGGFVGEYYTTAESPQNLSIRNSLTEGSIGVSSPSAFNIRRGGFMGSSSFGEVTRSIASYSLISGDSSIGGAFGYADDAKVMEAHLDNGLIKCTNNSLAVNCGGVVGEFDVAMGTGPFLYNIKSKASISAPNLNNNLINGNAGNIIGSGITGVENSFQNTFTVGEVTTLTGTYTGRCGGNTCGTAMQTGSTFNFTADIAICSSITGMTSPPVSDSSGVCRFLFEEQWANYSQDNLGPLSYYLAGNTREPFPLFNTGDWNGIGTDSFLLEKSFELKADLDFGYVDGNFTPIGGDDLSTGNPFHGELFSNNFSLKRVTRSSAAIDGGGKTSAGLIPMLFGGKIGRWGEPLRIKGLQLTCNHASCGVVGEARNSNISIVVEDGVINGASFDNIGGIVGKISSDGLHDSWNRINHSGFSGSITAGTGSYIGGFVGYGDFAGGSETIHVEIENSYAHLTSISGGGYVAGMIGMFNGSVDFDDSYVLLDKDQAHSGEDISSTSSSTYGLMGMNTGGGDFEIDDVYIHYANAVILPGFTEVSSSSTTYENNLVIIGPGDVSSSAMYYDFSDHDWFFDNTTNTLKLCWEDPVCLAGQKD
jgi:hypothetical protein